MLGMISLLNLLRVVLCPKLWSISENAPCELFKNVHSVILGWKFL